MALGTMAKCAGCKVAGRVDTSPERGTFLFDVMFMWNKCWVCGGKWSFSKITAKLAPSVVCDRSCTHASGASCTCSCGGANHGRDAHARPTK